MNRKKIKVIQKNILNLLWHKFKAEREKIIIKLKRNLSFVKKYYHYLNFFYEVNKFGYIKSINILILEIKNFFRIYFFRKYLKHKETILIVTHDCSLSGAPIVALNLVQFFKKNITL